MKGLKEKDISEYEDIINLPHHVSSKRPHMTMEGRAGQFAPFAALTGLDDQMDETGKKHEEGMLHRDVEEIEDI